MNEGAWVYICVRGVGHRAAEMCDVVVRFAVVRFAVVQFAVVWFTVVWFTVMQCNAAERAGARFTVGRCGAVAQ